MPFAIIAFGGNLGKPHETLEKAWKGLAPLGSEWTFSRAYRTKPVSPIPQKDFLNAACRFQTDLDPKELFFQLESLERSLGKVKKPKEAPRFIDLDLLFYGEEACLEGELVIPHPRWKERLFVLVPLADLIEEVFVEGVNWNIKELIEKFSKEEIQEVYDGACSS